MTIEQWRCNVIIDECYNESILIELQLKKLGDIIFSVYELAPFFHNVYT